MDGFLLHKDHFLIAFEFPRRFLLDLQKRQGDLKGSYILADGRHRAARGKPFVFLDVGIIFEDVIEVFC
jgi:hypothetical protein